MKKKHEAILNALDNEGALINLLASGKGELSFPMKLLTDEHKLRLWKMKYEDETISLVSYSDQVCLQLQNTGWLKLVSNRQSDVDY